MPFVDTSALIALADRSDGHHKKAATYLGSIPTTKRKLVTTDYILDETFTRLRFTIGLPGTVRFGEAIMRSALYTIVQVDGRVRREAWEWFKRYQDKDFSFTDCTSFVVMRALQLEEAFAFDEHFVQAGFLRVPQP